MDQYAREGAPQPGVWPGIVREAVRANHGEWMAQYPFNVFSSHAKVNRAAWHESLRGVKQTQAPVVGHALKGFAAVLRVRRRPADQHVAGARSLAICNVVGSMATRETEGTVYTHAGPEIGVASTKAFTSQLVALHLLALIPRQPFVGGR